MSDEADDTQARLEIEERLVREAIRYELPEGEAGECDYCGESSPRLINGACASCRMKYRLP